MQLGYSVCMGTSIYNQDMTKPRYVSANLLPATATELRTLTAVMTAETKRRVTTSDLLSALLTWGDAHRDELAALLRKEVES
jgi:hypothetical protein